MDFLLSVEERHTFFTAKRSGLLAAAGIGVLAAIGLAYYSGYLGSVPAERPSDSTIVTQNIAAPQLQLFYAATTARLRDQPTVSGSNVIDKLGRGEEANGAVVAGTAEGEYWLKLSDGSGFVNLVNLAASPAPLLQKTFDQKIIVLPNAARLLKAPTRGVDVIARLTQGTPVTASGITRNGYLEIIRKTGGVGYIADGSQIIADAQKPDLPPAIAIKIDSNGCAAGAEIEGLFKQIQNRQAAGLRRIEDAKYTDDDARDAAIARYRQRTESKSVIIPIARSFRGLTVSGLGIHPETQSVYFAEPPEQVRQVFRAAGYRVGRDGKLPSREIYASIDAGNSKFGKTDMGCGV